MTLAGRLPRPAPLGAAAVALCVALLAAGCASGDEATTTTTTSTPSATAVPTATAAPAATATSSTTLPEDEGTGTDVPFAAADADPSSDALLTVTGLRTGSHEGYDRVVVDLAGTGSPGWHAEVGATGVDDPTGETVDVGGSAVLTLYLTGIGYPFDTGQDELAAGTVVAGGDLVTAAAFSGTFEGQAQVFVGLGKADASYRVFLLQDPLRVVVDVQGAAS